MTVAMLDFSEIERVLVVMAHPDDVDFGAAGTVAKMTDAGIDVVYCLITDGQAGGFDSTISRDEMASIRRQEQTKAAAEVGVTDLRFLGHMDGTVEVSMDVVHVFRDLLGLPAVPESYRSLDSTIPPDEDIAAAVAALCV